MFKKAAAFARGGTLARCIAATRWPWVRLPGKRNRHFQSMSSPTQRTRKRLVLLGRSNFLMADIVPSDEHKPGITCSYHSHFAFTKEILAFLTTIAAILLWLYLQQIDEELKSLRLIYIKIFSSLKALWSAGRRTNLAVRASWKTSFFLFVCLFCMRVSYVFRRAHTLSGFMNGTMADEDGCSGLEHLKDYANGSPQREISQ